MAIIQSNFFKGNARTPTADPHRKHETITQMFSHYFTEALTTADILDLFPVFPGAKIVGFEFICENMATEALDIGLMSGTPGSKDAGRTSGDELIDGIAASTGGSTALATLANLAANGDTAVSIGVKTATNIAAGATKALHVKITLVS